MAEWITARRRPRLAKTVARGYGGEHQAERKGWAPKVKAGVVQCGVCARLILPNQPWHLDHIIPISLGGRDGPKHPAHRACNIAKGGKNRITS